MKKLVRKNQFQIKHASHLNVVSDHCYQKASQKWAILWLDGFSWVVIPQVEPVLNSVQNEVEEWGAQRGSPYQFPPVT